MRNIYVDWKGIIPSEDTKEQTESILSALKYILPPESDIRVCLEKYNKEYSGHLVVRSPVGDFAAHTEGKDLLQLCKTLRRNLKQQIFKKRDSRSQWTRAS